MKRHPINCIAAAFILLTASLFSCDDAENHNITLLDQAKVVIDMGMTGSTAPAAIGSIKVRVTGLDFGAIEKEFAPFDVISLRVKAGKLRRFEVVAFVAPGDPSPVASFRGTAVANVTAGSTVNVRMVMKTDEMKLVIPDYAGGYYSTGKLVMIDSINGGNRRSRSATDIGLSSLYPYDVDFDSQQRIYFANNNPGYADSGIYRMDDFNSTVGSGTCVQLVSDTSGVRTIAIDKKRNILYYVSRASQNPIYKLNLDGGIPELLTDSGYTLYYINSVCVDEQTGYIYYNFFTTGSGYSLHTINVFNPNTEIPGLLSYSYSSASNYTTDLIVKNGYLYASYTYWNNTTPNPAAVPRIIRLPLDLDTVTTPAVEISEKPDGTGQMIGPRVFLAVTNRKLYFVDETGTDDTTDRIISFDNINGSGWDTYGNADQFFRFYSTC